MPANVARATATAAAAGAKNVTCSICQEKFSRKDHLKRHQLRRESVLFSRSDDEGYHPMDTKQL